MTTNQEILSFLQADQEARAAAERKHEKIARAQEKKEGDVQQNSVSGERG